MYWSTDTVRRMYNTSTRNPNKPFVDIIRQEIGCGKLLAEKIEEAFKQQGGTWHHAMECALHRFLDEPAINTISLETEPAKPAKDLLNEAERFSVKAAAEYLKMIEGSSVRISNPQTRYLPELLAIVNRLAPDPSEREARIRELEAELARLRGE